MQVSGPSQMVKTARAGTQHRIAAEDPYFRAALQKPLVLQESWSGCSIKAGQCAHKPHYVVGNKLFLMDLCL